MSASSVFRTRGARLEPWQMALAAVLVGIAAAAVAVVLRSGVHLLFEALEPMREVWWGCS